MTGKKGRKKKSPGNLSTVSTGVLPSVAFAAVPKTPAPSTPPAANLQCAMSTGILNSSLLGKMFSSPDMDGDPLSDPESSLYDYNMMEEAGYSSVEFGAAQRRQRISYSDRAKEPSPVVSRREHAIDEMQQGGDMYHILEPTDNQQVSDIYATPNKPGRKKQHSGSHQSLTDDGQSLQQTGQRVRDAMRAVQDMPSDSDEINETMGFQVHRRVQISADVHRSSRNELIPGDKEPSIKETSVKQVEHQTPKTPRTPTRQEKQEVNQKSNEPRQKVEEEIIQVTHRSGSNTARSIKSLPRSGSATARRTDEVQRSLEGENSLLRSKTEHLESEVHSLQQVTAALDRGDKDTAANLLLKKQLAELKEENDTLKSAVHRLSVELSAYQAKYRPLSEGQVGDILGLPDKGPIPSWLINIRYLAPLFLAYDDRIQEKDNILRKYQNDMERLRIDAEDIVTENQELHTKLEKAMTKGPVDLNEWEQLKENAKLVLEENQNLLEQIDVKDQKSHDLHQAHIREVSKLTKELVQIKSEKSDTEMEIQEIRKKYKDLKHKYDEIMLDQSDKPAAESYLNTISELKMKIQEIQTSHKEETENLRIKIQVSQEERKKQASQMIELTAENKRLQSEMKYMHKAVKKAQSKMMYLQQAIEHSESKEYSVQEYLATVIKMVL
ncbi:hypothetical protein KUTeg_019753 [Tegillarca granosa]|uniref:Uncharacterized protein n=1 Tax=Tegillarca granosa TaxID=220873 RepID=A0ABQ9EIH0_TEGGR|nr:hypothetical protein KUTeg_019753 [Tegillarca granosa]